MVEDEAKQEIRMKQAASRSLPFNPEDGGNILPKRLLTFNGLHGFISQTIQHFITTAVGTSNST
jgi:hypothetical protein